MTTRPIWVWILAVLAPMALLGGGYARLAAPDPVREDPLVTRFEKLARNKDLPVVLLGASYVDSNIDPAVLHRELGLKGSAGRFGVGASTGAVWYAVLKERIYGNGMRPKLILLPVTISSALSTALVGANAEKLTAQMPEPDEVVLQRSYGSTVPAAVQRVLDRRARLRDPLLDVMRTLVPQLALNADITALEAAGRTVFGEHHEAAGPRILPVVEAGDDVTAKDAMATAAPELSYLADIVEMAKQNGARVVLVLPPVAPGMDEDPGITPAIEAKVVRWAHQQGVGYLDLRQSDFSTRDFLNGRHMHAAAAKRFSAMVAEHLLDMDVFGSGPLRSSAMPAFVTGVKRIGKLPPAPKGVVTPGELPCSSVVDVTPYAFLGGQASERLGAGILSPIRVSQGGRALTDGLTPKTCEGRFVHRAKVIVDSLGDEAGALEVGWAEEVPIKGHDGRSFYWVFPQTSLRWGFEGGGDAAPREVVVRAVLLGPGSAEVEVAGVVAPLVAEGDGWVARVPVPATNAWTVEVRSAAPFVLVRSIALSSEGEEQFVVLPEEPAGFDILLGKWAVAEAPPAPTDAVVSFEEGHAFAEAAWSNDVGCSPLLVAEDGVPLKRASPDRWRSTGRQGVGVQHIARRIWFDATGGGDPRANGRRYTVVHDADRLCGTSFCAGCGRRVWLYPGDTLRVPVTRPMRAPVGGARLAVDVVGNFNEVPLPTAPVRVRATLRDAVLLDAEVAAEPLLKGTRLRLSEVVPSSEFGDVILEISTTPDSPPVLLSLSLRAF